MASQFAALLAVTAGVATHLLYFRVGEHHLLGLTYLKLFALAFTVAVTTLVTFARTSVAEAFLIVTSLAASWLFGVFSSLIVYRLLLHPLNGFPGPWQARLGDLYITCQLKALNGHHVSDELHKKYGQYVRVGSNSLSITDADFMQPTYGAQSKVGKSDFYDRSLPHSSLNTTRDKGLHDRRRRVWASAFSDRALREYEETIRHFNKTFIARIGEHAGNTVNVTTWFNLYGFDVMGRLAFGKDYGMLEAGQRHWALDLLTAGIKSQGLKLPTWLFRILIKIPGAAGGYHKFFKFCSDELRLRIKKGGNNDITSWLLKAYGNETQPEEDLMLHADSRLIIVAGSDTTSATLTFLSYYLALDPMLQKKLRDELNPLTSKSDWSDRDIQYAKHLNGAINEALRLHPAVPSGMMRKTSSEGLQVGETYLPGNVNFCTPQYPMGRDERLYVKAEKFMPERWYSKPEFVKHPDAFAPFSQGPFNCIGRNLALMELRTLTAHILLNFDIALAPGEDGSRLLTQSQDHFIISVAPLDLVFTPLPK